MPLKVEPILPRFGAECSGLDLTRKLTPEEVQQVTDAMDTWGVTVWRQTGMSDADHVEFSRNFGYLERVPRREGVKYRLSLPELFDASNLNVEGEITRDEAAIQYRKGDRLWHTDSAFMEKRTSYSLLLAHEVPPEGGETWFADTRSAYEDLPAETKELLEGKIGVNSLWPYTLIATSAMKIVSKDADVQERRWRSPTIVAEAAARVVEENAQSFTGQFLVDELYLREKGFTNDQLRKFNVDEQTSVQDLAEDLYISQELRDAIRAGRQS